MSRYDFDFMPDDVWFSECEPAQSMMVTESEPDDPHVLYGPDGESLGRPYRRIGFDLRGS